jgi:DNA-binding CsgD family transcriptional regulator
VRHRSAGTVTTLTAQKALIVRLARDGRTNPEIGVQVFLSARTVEWHLGKIFTKVGIGSHPNCTPRWNSSGTTTSRLSRGPNLPAANTAPAEGGPRRVWPAPGSELITRICTIADWFELGRTAAQIGGARAVRSDAP